MGVEGWLSLISYLEDSSFKALWFCFILAASAFSSEF